jgi:acyl carrier protein
MSTVPQSPVAGQIDVETVVRRILADVLSLAPGVTESLNDDSPLFGAIPELDSMAVAGLLTELEDRLTIVIDDDEVDADLFETFGALVRFAEAKSSN